MKTLALALLAAVSALAQPLRQPGPCDIYEAASTPCVAAHSTTRALYSSYNGPLYQVKRESDGKTRDIGVIGGYADAARQDTFCARSICVINVIYDQTGRSNHLYQAAPGPSFPGPAKGGFDTQPIADMARVTVGGHKVYGVYIMPGMGLRNNNASGIAINDEPEGIYYVIDGKHYDSGCCFDYGNSSTNGRAVGTGTMETTYFGTSTVWGSGGGPGPWIMSDMEAGLFSGYNARQNPTDPTADSWRFVTAVVDGGGGNRWDLRGGSAQAGRLTTYYSGVRPESPGNKSYYPMHKQGGILLGTGGDNGNGSSGTFYEGVMTTGYPSEATTDAVQANIVAARYGPQPVSLSRLKAFTPGSAQDITETFTNTTGSPVQGVRLSVTLPPGWTATAAVPTAFIQRLEPDKSLAVTFRINSPRNTARGPGADLLAGRAEWKDRAGSGKLQFDTSTTRVRNVPAVKINEVGLGGGPNASNQFIELYNASASTMDLSNWSLVHTPSQWPPLKLATIPAATQLAPGAYYLLGLAGSGLAAPVNPGAAAVSVRSVAGLSQGVQVQIGDEARRIVLVGTPAQPLTTLFAPVSTGPWLTIPAGATNLPVANAAGFEVGQKIGIDTGGNYETGTVTGVGKAGTQTTLSGPATAGESSIRVAVDQNVTAGDTLTVGTGSRKETLRARIAADGKIELAEPLKRDHSAGVDVSDAGTGISFSPPTKFAHTSGEAVQALGGGIELDRPLTRRHEDGTPLVAQSSETPGYSGSPAPNQWFGAGLSNRAGSLALLDGRGVIVDALVYGSQQSNSSANGTITSPELATLVGDQGNGGCIAVGPAQPRGGATASATEAASRSIGRFPDGADTGSECLDFHTQAVTIAPIASDAGEKNIKVVSVTGFRAGQKVTIDSGANAESAVIAAVGTPGATTAGQSINPGVTTIAVGSVAGFSAGQIILVDSGANQEKAVIVSVSARGGAIINLSAPLTSLHAPGAPVTGTGISLTTPLTRAHTGGVAVIDNVATPGAPNRY